MQMLNVKKIFAAALVFVAGMAFVSCQDKVDESSMYTFTGKLMSDFFTTEEDMSDFCYLTKKVKLSKYSESTVYDLLSARGNFTCFAPTNEAVQTYLDSLYNTTNYDITLTPDSTAEFIVNNCLIDHANSSALESTSFIEGTIEQQSFAGRFVTVNFGVVDGRAAIYIDKFSRIINSDIKVENGMVHKVETVVAPTISSLATLIEATPNLQVFSNLLKATGYDAVLSSSFRDMDYEENHPKTGLGTPTFTGENAIPCPEHRDMGYTAFVETDSVFEVKLGVKIEKVNGQIANWDEVLAAIEKKSKEYYPNATNTDYASDDNALHQFVGYHLVNRSVPYNYLNIHFNEQGYGYRNPENLSIDTWCYYPTLTQNRILKIMEGRQIDGKRINRYVSKRDPLSYSELEVPREGILLHNEGENAALNGYFYTIDDMLVYDDDVPNKVLNERMRYDICDLLPEQMSSGFRRITGGDGIKGVHIPPGYHTTMWFTDESRVVYLPGYNQSWRNYQGDEYNIVGQYDVTLELPHVPYYGTYEFRIGLSNNDWRGMCQVYFGTNRQNLEAIGLPLDMRLSGSNPVIGWETDKGEEDYDGETAKRMRIHGYKKAPKYYGSASTSAVRDNFRNIEKVMRYTAYTGTFDPNKTYYVRFKSVLENTSTELFLDYFELVPKTVYNGAEEEDDW